jgi:hypothetical protein
LLLGGDCAPETRQAAKTVSKIAGTRKVMGPSKQERRAAQPV